MAGAENLSQRNCPICDADNRGEMPHFLSAEPWLLKSCGSCGLVYLENPPDYSALEDEFAWEKSYATEARRRAEREPLRYRLTRRRSSFLKTLGRRKRKLPALAEKYVQGGRIVDVGCGDGKWLAMLDGQFEPYGIEISPAQVTEARRKTKSNGGKIVQGDAITGLTSFPSDHFDGALMHAYLEHEIHPKAVLKEASRVLRPGGHLIVKVPNFACLLRRLRGKYWCGLRFPDHVSYFSPTTLQDLLNRCGFEMVQSRFVDHLPTSDNMWCVAAKQTAVIPFPLEAASSPSGIRRAA